MSLEALERSDLSRLPGGIFTRAFIRAYAEEVGLDPDRTIEDFIAELPPEAATATAHFGQIEDGEKLESDRRAVATAMRLAAHQPADHRIWSFTSARAIRLPRQTDRRCHRPNPSRGAETPVDSSSPAVRQRRRPASAAASSVRGVGTVDGDLARKAAHAGSP